MNYQQAKEAFNEFKEIKCLGVVYKNIQAIIFRRANGLEVVQLELLDKSGNSVTVAKMKDCEVAGEDNS